MSQFSATNLTMYIYHLTVIHACYPIALSISKPADSLSFSAVPVAQPAVSVAQSAVSLSLPCAAQ